MRKQLSKEFQGGGRWTSACITGGVGFSAWAGGIPVSRVHSKHRSGLWGRWLGRPGIPAFSRVDGHVQHGVFVLGGGEELGFVIDTL